MRFFVLLLVLFSVHVQAHEVQSSTQYVNIRRQKESGWQQTLVGKIDYNRKFQFGAIGSYLERFDIYDKQAGGLLLWRPDDKWTIEGRYLQGMGNDILPEKMAQVSAYYAWGNGLAPFLIYRDNRYSVTTVHSINLGIEIEKIPHIIIIPMVMGGRATFKTPAKSDDVNSYGLRAVYYNEGKYSFSVFGFRGKEASQGIIGASTVIVDTLTGGLSGTYYFTPDLKTELVFDHTDYDQLNTEFHTTTLNITWMF